MASTPRGWRRSEERLQLGDVPATTFRPQDRTIALIRGGDSPGAFVLFAGTPAEGGDDVVPFGRVIQGMNVVAQLLAETADGVNGKDFIDIRRVIRTK